MAKELTTSAQKVQDALTARGLTCLVVELPDSTRTAEEAAMAVGCKVGQIVKSLVFRGKLTGQPILVLASGPNRVDEIRIGELVSEPIEKANADFVREKTGFVIGGVPPIGHMEALPTYIDEDLLQYQDVWAAAGTPKAVFKIYSSDLKRATGGTVVSIK